MELVKANFPTRWMVKSTIAVHVRLQIEALGLSQKEAARICEVTQPRISNLLSGNMDLFSTDSLIDIAEKLNLQVSVRVQNEPTSPT